MSNKSGVSDQIISLPKGGGELKGLGEKFQADLHTGTGNFSIPISVPSGRNGFQPQLSLNYSTGSGIGAFGLGWALGIPNIGRKTSKGIPKYYDKFDGDGTPVWHEEEDIFILSGAEDLVHVGNGFYRPRTELLFAKIRKIRAADGQICWQVTTRDGIKSIYGKTCESRVFISNNGITRIFQWLLSETIDTFGNKIVYNYRRDDGADVLSNLGQFTEERNHSYNQTYLQSIEYVNYENAVSTKFLFKVELDYGQFDNDGIKVIKDWDIRPDRSSSYSAGLEIRTTRRCKRIIIKRRLGNEGSADLYELVRTYEFGYEQDVFTSTSLLKSMQLKGHKDGKIESFPPMNFGYTQFDPEKRRYEIFSSQQGYLPEKSLADPNYEIIDLFGNGLPCVVHSSPTTGWRYWRNLGNMQFALPRSMKMSPATGVTLADDGVQFADMDGDGSVELLAIANTLQTGREKVGGVGESNVATSVSLGGYYTKNSFNGEWEKFHHLRQVPSFSLEDPNVKLVDLDGDGVVDVLSTASDHHFLFIRNKNHHNELEFANPIAIERKHNLDEWPDVYFGTADQRVRLADMSGDGMQDIVLAHSGRIDYWPNLGYGRFGKRITMRANPRFSHNFDPKRLFLTDVNSDGLADLVYVDHGKVQLWINQSGNSWSSEIVILGTPRASDMDSVRITDMKGTGTAGILWSYDYYSRQDKKNYKYLDFTGGSKPLLLTHINNNIGAETCIEYLPSTWYYLKDSNNGLTWKTNLPFPVQVVALVDIYDHFSKNRFTTKYLYHHGHWDGVEKETRGFGRVDQRNTEVFENYNSGGLHSDKEFYNVPLEFFSPPTEVRTWFHQGPIGSRYDWQEVDFSDEFWQEDPQILSLRSPLSLSLTGPFSMELPSMVKRSVVRSLRGQIVRTELYALDDTNYQNRPYTVTEYMHDVLSLPIDVEFNTDTSIEDWRLKVFFPCSVAERTTQWERGNDPMTKLKFIGEYDRYGQPCSEIAIAVPRGRDYRVQSSVVKEPYLVTHTAFMYAYRDDEQKYIANRISGTTTYEIKNDGKSDVFLLKDKIERKELGAIVRSLQVTGQTINFYDGSPFVGLSFGEMGDYGAVVRTETLILTNENIQNAYQATDDASIPAEKPPYIQHDTTSIPWTSEYPPAFQNSLKTLAGYIYHSQDIDADYETGYYSITERRKYDFQDPVKSDRGMVIVKRDPLGNDTEIEYDMYDLLPVIVRDAIGLSIQAKYDYRTLQPSEFIDPNENRSHFQYTPFGLLESISISGKPSENEGDLKRPSIQFQYNLMSFLESAGRQPINTTTIKFNHYETELGLSVEELNESIKTMEFFDGFGRITQVRTQAEDTLFGEIVDDKTIGTLGLSATPPFRTGNAKGGLKQKDDPPFVIVSGWQIYDNKGRIVTKYEPFFSQGWLYKQPNDTDLQDRASVKIYYDSLGRVIRTINADSSEQQVVYGVPGTISVPDLSTLEAFEPSPWESYTYDVNDNAGRSHQIDSARYASHWNTPTSIVVDALGHTVKTTTRNGSDPNKDWYDTVFTYDIKGNLLVVTDPLGRSVFKYVYDLVNRSLRMNSIDAGTKIIVLDSGGNIIERRDSKRALALYAYDSLSRRIKVWARDEVAQSISLREVLIYGDDAGSGLTNPQALALNLLGKIYMHYDEAGLLSFIPNPATPASKPYDFKGNVLEKVRYVINDDQILAGFDEVQSDWQLKTYSVDWESTSRPKLEHVGYRTSTKYDALNRLEIMLYPENEEDHKRAILRHYYNRAGALERIILDGCEFVKHIAYNASGQRTLILYGNGIMSRYVYDCKTFRLVRLCTEKYTESSSPLTFDPAGDLLQDFAYHYDLAGNILSINDSSPGCGVGGSNKLDRLFTYYPIYNIESATGRISKRVLTEPLPPPWSDGLYNSSQNETVSYRQIYHYDKVGNMQILEHHTDQENVVRKFNHEIDSTGGKINNRLFNLIIGNTSYHYTYDASGNLVHEGSTRHFEWDHSDHMKSYYTRSGSVEPSIYVRYLYDSAGQRIKKLARMQGGSHIETTVYVDGLFEYHRYITGHNIYENNILHVMDNANRVALIRIGNDVPNNNTPKIKYLLGDNLGSGALTIDDSGTWVDREEYMPFGETSFGSFYKKRYRFNGKERDEESSLYYYGARYYAPWAGRWMNTDPAELFDGLNPYSYVKNNPLKYVDPSGLQAEAKGSTEYSRTEVHASTSTEMDTERGKHTARKAREAGVGGGPYQQHHHADAQKTKKVGLHPDISGESERMSTVHSQRDPTVKAEVSSLEDAKKIEATRTHHNAAKLRDQMSQSRVPDTPEGLIDASAESKKTWPATADYGERAKMDWTPQQPVGPDVDKATGKVVGPDVGKDTGNVIDKTKKVGSNAAGDLAETTGKSATDLAKKGSRFLTERVMKSIILIGAAYTILSADEVNAETIGRAVAGEIGIGPVDMELMIFDIAPLRTEAIENIKKAELAAGVPEKEVNNPMRWKAMP